MKNSASNSPITQALCIQQVLKEKSAHLLPALIAALTQSGYDDIRHQRLSQQVNDNTAIYQGLTRAQHLHFGSVMIKWELSPDSNPDISNFTHSSSTNLSHEGAVLVALNTSHQPKNNTAPIAPPILAYDTAHVQVSEQSQQLSTLVMPYYKNGSLAHYLRQYLLQQSSHKKLSDKQKHQLIVQSAYLIVTLHNRGWLHNDIKPSNILLDGSVLLDSFLLNSAGNGNTTPRLLLTDFALAQRCDKAYITNAAGTPSYLAPERWQGLGATVQSDIYAFGIMMYEILTGVRPFKISPQSSEPLRDWAIEHCQKPIPLLPTDYRHYQSIITKALAKRMERRYKSMGDLLGSLDKCSI